MRQMLWANKHVKALKKSSMHQYESYMSEEGIIQSIEMAIRSNRFITICSDAGTFLVHSRRQLYVILNNLPLGLLSVFCASLQHCGESIGSVGPKQGEYMHGKV